MLLVVRPSQMPLFQYLQQSLAGVRGVAAIIDRRNADRRSARRDVPADKRRSERRQPRGEVNPIGYTTVRFGRSEGTQN